MNNNPVRYSDPSGHDVGCAGEDASSCDSVGKFNKQRRALNLLDKYIQRKNSGTVTYWARLAPTEQGIMSDAGWTSGVFADALTGGVSPADALHDPATYIIGSVAVGGIVKAGVTLLGVAGATNVSNQAKSWQGTGEYPGVDKWEDVIIKKGSTVWGGEPGQGYFYTGSATMASAGNDATKIFQGLQVGLGEYTSFRAGMTQYLVTQNVNAARAIALANPQHGAGGYVQYYIPNYQDVLRPIYTVLLNNR